MELNLNKVHDLRNSSGWNGAPRDPGRIRSTTRQVGATTSRMQWQEFWSGLVSTVGPLWCGAGTCSRTINRCLCRQFAMQLWQCWQPAKTETAR
jgi:hypothetical protein